MRNLKKNQLDFWYALYRGKVPVKDENGDNTGDDATQYSPPVHFSASLSGGKGDAQKDIFGVDIDFTRSVSTVETSLPIDETSLVWHETKPILLEDGTADPDSADYIVAAKPAKSLNVLVIPLKARARNKAV